MQIPLSAQSSPAPVRVADDQGIFEIFSQGKRIGTDAFEIHFRGNHVEASGNGHFKVDQNGKTIEVETTSNFLLDPQLHPISYTWSQKGAQSSRLSVDFRTQPAHARYKQVNGQDDKRDFKLDPDVVILDDNEVQDYELALGRYDQTKNAPMVLSGFTPQEALPGVIILSYLGPDQVTLNGDRVTLRHYVLAVASTQIHLWADDQGRLQMVSAGDSQFQAVRMK